MADKPSLGDKLGDIGEKFSSLLKAGKNLPGKILLNLKDAGEDGSNQTDGTPPRLIYSPSQRQSTESYPEGPQSGSDPLQGSVRLGSSPAGSVDAFGSTPPRLQTVQSMATRVPEHRMNKFHTLLAAQVIDLDALRELCWNGVPPELRPTCWRLLMGYMPPNKARQATILSRKRQEYQEMVPQYYDVSNAERSEEELTALRQVILDVPRTAPTVPFFHDEQIQKSLERLLYIWGIRHPASGYVQGMNDLVTPFLAVF